MPLKSYRDLLPSSSLPSERALSLAAQCSGDILPEDIKNLWNLETVPGRFLSYLAWGLHVDFWRDSLSESYKRELIAGSFTWHRKKGTPWAIKKVLADLGVEARVLEWFDIGTEPHTFAVEAEFDYANSEPFSITEDMKTLYLEAIECTKPERSHLAYFTFVPIGEDDPTHRCLYDVCHFSHGYLWVRDMGTYAMLEPLTTQESVQGCMQLRTSASAAYQWSALYDAYRFSDPPFEPITSSVWRYFIIAVEFSHHYHRRRWSGNHTWEKGTWEKDGHPQKPSETLLVFARSTGVFGAGEVLGDCNCTYSGGYELVVPYIGSYGVELFSSCVSEGACFRPILEFTEHSESIFVKDNLLKGVYKWES